MPSSADELVQAIRWKLGLPCQGDSRRARDVWDEFAQSASHAEEANEICLRLAEHTYQTALRHSLDLLRDHLVNQPNKDLLDSLAKSFRQWATNAAASQQVTQILRQVVACFHPDPPPPVPSAGTGERKAEAGRAVTGPAPSPTPSALAPAKSPPTREAVRTGLSDSGGPSLSRGAAVAEPVEVRRRKAAAAYAAHADTLSPPSDAAPSRPAASLEPAQENRMNQDATTSATPPVTSQWKHLPVSEHEPDRHDEYDQQTGAAPRGWLIIGARVRGKKHKHEGTNCDDWFAWATSGEWSILAVSDGAGSKKFSRVGARAATTAAVDSLTRDLALHQVRSRDDWSSASFQEDDLVRVDDAVQRSVLAAWDAVQQAADSRAASAAHRSVLGCDLTVADLSTTLLVAVHCLVRSKDERRSLVFGCSVGDGMIAAIGQDGSCRLLMTPDSGEHSGETRFLEPREITPGKLRQRIFPFLGPLQALLLMTDGVADDYFPNDPGMSHLYGDLVLNGILPCDSSEPARVAALAPTRLPSRRTVSAAEYWMAVPNPAVGNASVRIRSLRTFAEKLGLTPAQVVGSPPLLAAGCLDDGRGDNLGDERDRSARLRMWLDAYQVRGSFDDRTLLILHR